MKRVLLAVVWLLALCVAAGAAPERELRFKADRMDYDEESHRVRLIGNVKIWTDQVTMTSPYAEYHTDKQEATFDGGVKIVGEGSTAVGNKMRVFYAEQKAVLKGNVRLVTERAPGGKEPATPTVLLANELDYLWEKGLGHARGDVKVRQGDRRAFSDTATYQRNDQVIVMEGNVRFERGADDWLSAERARMNLVTETITAEGGVVARTVVTEQQKEDAPPAEEPLPAPEVLEPEFPVETVEKAEPILLPGLDD
ncbi:MAG: LPS export ABC transporter periplasmic protein LptC [Armatimonadetes bacterium]|nr:LPS export ABC transporter periplasmic protein LptC [Armatimonadota bacterium]